MNKLRITLMSLFLIVSFGVRTPALAADPGLGTIQGQLTNATAGTTSSVAGQTVTMITFLNTVEASTATAKSDANGKFVFSGLSTGLGYSYEFKTKYQEADYASEPVNFSVNETNKTALLTVYDSTDKSDSVRISAAHTIVYPGAGILEVVEYLIFNNNSDRAYIGTTDANSVRRTLKFYIPADAKDIQFTGAAREFPDGYFDTVVVVPGQTTIAYSYTLNNSSSSYRITQQMNYPVDTYSFLVQAGMQASSPQLVSSGPVQMSANATFNVLSGNNLPSGQLLEIQLTRPGGGSSHVAIIAVLVVAVLGVVGGFAFFMRKREPQLVESGGSSDIQQTLLAEMATLDDDFEGGRIEKASYERLRAEKKALLVKLMQNSAEARSKG